MVLPLKMQVTSFISKEVYVCVCIQTNSVLATNTVSGTLSACFKSSTFGEIISLPQYMTVKISINIMHINKYQNLNRNNLRSLPLVLLRNCNNCHIPNNHYISLTYCTQIVISNYPTWVHSRWQIFQQHMSPYSKKAIHMFMGLDLQALQHSGHTGRRGKFLRLPLRTHS
jgi:hypothetical protein